MSDSADDLLTATLADGGPRYRETLRTLESDPQALVIEPWNAVSALAFVALALLWLWRLRGQFRRYPLVFGALPVLLLGGIGGTLYHAFRWSPIFLYLDFVPIYLLGSAACVYLWLRAGLTRWQVLTLLLIALGVQAAAGSLTHQWRIMLSYATLAGLLVPPAAWELWRSGGRHGQWVILACACFGLAFSFRYADFQQPPLLPMGTHWLWHTFGAATTAALIEYFFRLERDSASGARAIPASSLPSPGRSLKG